MIIFIIAVVQENPMKHNFGEQTIHHDVERYQSPKIHAELETDYHGKVGVFVMISFSFISNLN